MTIELGVLIPVAGLVIGFLGYQHNKQKQTKTETKQDAEVRTQLNYISKGVDDIKVDLRAQDRQMVLFGERLTRVEESSKQAHKRIDTIENKEDK